MSSRDVVEIGDYPAVVLILVLEVLDRAVDGVEGNGALQLVEHLLDKLLRLPHGPENFVQPFLEELARSFHLLLRLFVEVGEFLRREGFAGCFFLQGDDEDAGDTPLDGKTFLPRLLLELRKKLALLVLELFDDLALLLLVLLGLESLGYVGPQGLDEVFHVFPEDPAFSRIDRYGQGQVGVLEVVYVTPIGRDLLACRLLLEHVHYRAHFPRARFSQGKDVEAFGNDLESEIEGPESLLLSYDSDWRRHVFGGNEIELIRIAGFAQIVGTQFYRHNNPL